MYEEQMEFVQQLTGEKCQVYSEANEILFVGRILEFDRNRELLKIADDHEGDVPWRIISSGMGIKLFMSLIPGGEEDERIFIDCTVKQSLKDCIVAKIKAVIVKEESRDHFRQHVMADNIVARAGDEENSCSCTVVNVSARGMGIECMEEYEAGECLEILDGKFREEGSSYHLKCKVVRKKRLEGGRFFYGCEFVDMSREEERRLLNDIFALQTEELRAKKIR